MSTLARIQDSQVILLGSRPAQFILSISIVSSKIDLIKSSIMNKEVSLAKKIRQEVKKDVHEELKKNQKSTHQVTFRKGATRQRQGTARKF